MQQTFKSVEMKDLDELAKKLITQHSLKIWLMLGEMGAGKTTFVKSFCKALQVVDNMSSPTFSIVNEYKTESQSSVFHFDFYRIKNQQEAFDIGVEEYFYSNEYCFIEWPERIPDLLPEQWMQVSITIENENQRTIQVTQHG
ncbi:MAG: tRNA (adenosine(37)-N6)-threonylcarbamoyltransferase complex ATPase subunit type 1 TsaE [Cyclobacteriaceae bacterium]|nr:tRNA (adenosine(37)-N6)-threonylcarbamoyltransferase complex ATPase subunit type 1 TsaE [Cyclobacteriaceae bacterium]